MFQNGTVSRDIARWRGVMARIGEDGLQFSVSILDLRTPTEECTYFHGGMTSLITLEIRWAECYHDNKVTANQNKLRRVTARKQLLRPVAGSSGAIDYSKRATTSRSPSPPHCHGMTRLLARVDEWLQQAGHLSTYEMKTTKGESVQHGQHFCTSFPVEFPQYTGDMNR